MREAISVRLPEDIATRLEDLAKSLERPKTYIVTKALREYLEEYEDYLVALHRLNDKNDRVGVSPYNVRDTQVNPRL